MARILVVNDEADLVSICEMVLEEAAYEVDALTDGRSGLELARRTRPDLVILDWILREAKGEDVLRQLRTDPATARIPILMVSAIPDGDTMARTYGTDGFLKKPFMRGPLPASPLRSGQCVQFRFLHIVFDIHQLHPTCSTCSAFIDRGDSLE
jgi:DNA-binding response OmpR family regulator